MKLEHRFFRTPTRSRARPGPAPVSTTQAIGITLELGSLMAVCVLLGLVAGQALDTYLGTEPVLTLLGVAVGVACTLLGTLRQYRAAARLRAAELEAANRDSQPLRALDAVDPAAVSASAPGASSGGRPYQSNGG